MLEGFVTPIDCPKVGGECLNGIHTVDLAFWKRAVILPAVWAWRVYKTRLPGWGTAKLTVMVRFPNRTYHA
ncbi:MAG: hypothetical protein OXI43_20695 [Candidatus Poribacteria bacterium]|nr:hypothetical protein [Candidatus Poribacteria bacterium]